MKRLMLCVVLLLVLPALACSFSVDTGGETDEATTAPPPTKEAAEPSPTAFPTKAPPTPVPPTPTVPLASGPSFYDVGFASGVSDDGKPLDLAVNFPVGTTMVYAFASYDGMTDGLECESVWYADGQEAVRDPFEWALGETGGPIWVSNVSNENGFSSAEYTWELYVDGDLMVAASFVVDGAAPSPVLFQDDFSDPGSGWEVADYDDGSVGYRDGVYYLTSSVENTVIWSWAGLSVSDVVIEVEATQVYAGPEDDNCYGVMCRVQPNDDAYLLRISGDGYYSIHRRTGGNYDALVDWAASDVIRQGNSTNGIRAVCDGPRLVLLVNGQMLAEASDSTLAQGDVALIVGTYEDAATEVHFDNLVVTRPAP